MYSHSSRHLSTWSLHSGMFVWRGTYKNEDVFIICACCDKRDEKNEVGLRGCGHGGNQVYDCMEK